ncbi:DNA polymerase I [Entomospira entomophila]|uniref:DNA polymerase I n=1 Tax=Entomospira entomophila TaxID=2719988 RepID=A0A968KU59_9SPIO|nr:DNA polymerase I [Entomospira entomophilus]NIZ41116.1 DNA polymerase I [Entomospira entomophilus]WDI35324.1 DNA polymerase I [Entomospira entomophilus]
MSEPLYILDGYALIYRSYYSMGNKPPIRNKRDENITAIMGFFRSFTALIKHYNIQHIVVALDSKVPTFRKERYPSYKANRDATPQELHEQANLIESMLHEAGIQTICIDKFEADDIIASIATQRVAQGLSTVIISGDKDLMQLINHHTSMLRFTSKREFKAGVEPIAIESVVEKMGVYPEQIQDYLALIGDASDNIPGVAGVGPKSAIKLLSEFHSLAQIYHYITKVTPAGLQTKLVHNRDNAFLSKELIKLACDIQLPLPVDNTELFSLEKISFSSLIEQLHRLEIYQVAEDLRKIATTKTTSHQHLLPTNATESNTPTKRLPLTFETITTISDAIQLCKTLKNAKRFAYDSETSGLNPHTDRLIGMSFSIDGKHGYYIPFSAPMGESTVSLQEILPLIKDLLEDPTVEVIGQNLKFDYQFLRKYDIIMKPYFDTMIAAWLLDSEARVNLDTLASQYLQHTTIAYKDIVSKNESFDDVPLSIASEYACEDASLTILLAEIFLQKLEENHLTTLFFSLEMPLVSVLAEMEWRGIYIDKKELSSLGKELHARIQHLEETIFAIVGHQFNIQSPKQLATILFEEMKFPNLKKNSTDIHILEELQRLHPQEAIIQHLIDYRKLTKLNSTYVEGLLKEASAEGNIHTSFLQTGTASGRLSSTQPNLQNIPIKDELGRSIRGVFKAREGYTLISADYSQIELVVLAHLAKDSTMLEIFQSGRDLHQETASFLFSTPLESVTSEQRRIGKTINFGVIYGMSAFRLSNELQIPRHLATQFIESYFTRYAGVSQFIQETIVNAQQSYAVRTISQRMRKVLQINSNNRNERSASERVALNTVIQGSAADIVKQAMLFVTQAIHTANIDAHLLLQVHDELIFEVRTEALQECQTIIAKSMHQAGLSFTPPIQLSISMESGYHWGEFH